MPEVLLAATVSGGRAPFTCVWSDCCGTELGTGREYVATERGTYIVTVTGQNGCSGMASIVVGEDRIPPAIEVSASGVLTCSVREVTLQAAVYDGRPPYTLSWLDPQSASIGSLNEVVVSAPGIYTVTATGQNGCAASASITVVENVLSPMLDLGPDLELTCDQPEISLAALPTGGTPPFTYLWTDGQGSALSWEAELIVHAPGTYVATVIGSNGCSVSDTVVVRDGIEPPIVDVGPDCELDCCAADIELRATVNGGVPPYTYEWYDDCGVLMGTEETLRVTKAGTYLLIVRSADGCIASDSIEVLEPGS